MALFGWREGGDGGEGGRRESAVRYGAKWQQPESGGRGESKGLRGTAGGFQRRIEEARAAGKEEHLHSSLGQPEWETTGLVVSAPSGAN